MNKTYVAIASMGKCKRCGQWRDLRYGACFSCSPFIDGKKIPGGDELWSIDNPKIRWKVKTQ